MLLLLCIQRDCLLSCCCGPLLDADATVGVVIKQTVDLQSTPLQSRQSEDSDTRVPRGMQYAVLDSCTL